MSDVADSKRIMAEFAGTAFMVAAGCGSVALNWSLPMICITFGLAVTIAIMVFGGISGAHINPAVSIAFWHYGLLEKEILVKYIVAQCAGGILGAVLSLGAGPTVFSTGLVSGFLIEVVITFILMAVIILVVELSGKKPMIAVVVGACVAINAYLFAAMTGASMTPARTLGPNLLAAEFTVIPIYFISTIIGAVLASIAFKRVFTKTVESV